MPNSFYVILRIIITGTCLYYIYFISSELSPYDSFNLKTIILGLSFTPLCLFAIVYNPIFIVHFKKSAGNKVNILVLIFFILLIFSISKLIKTNRL